jgi:hypothetical protein
MERGPKLTRASISKSYRGDIEGEGTLEYLMIYREDGSADFAAKATWFVVEGSGTGDLRGLHGEGGFASAHAEHYPITFNYEFD